MSFVALALVLSNRAMPITVLGATEGRDSCFHSSGNPCHAPPCAFRVPLTLSAVRPSLSAAIAEYPSSLIKLRRDMG
jgi:hypothetical protein